jgi:hypothetical protein
MSNIYVNDVKEIVDALSSDEGVPKEGEHISNRTSEITSRRNQASAVRGIL